MKPMSEKDDVEKAASTDASPGINEVIGHPASASASSVPRVAELAGSEQPFTPTAQGQSKPFLLKIRSSVYFLGFTVVR